MDPVGLYWPPSIGGLYQYILMEYVPTHFLIMVFVVETISICDGSIVFFQQGIIDTRSAHYIRVCSD